MTSRLTGHTRIQVLYYSDSPTKIEDTTKNRNGYQQLTQGTKESDSHAFVTGLFGINPSTLLDLVPCLSYLLGQSPIQYHHLLWIHGSTSPAFFDLISLEDRSRVWYARCTTHTLFWVCLTESFPCLGQWHKCSITSHSTHDVACEVCLVSEIHQLWLCCVRMLTLINV